MSKSNFLKIYLDADHTIQDESEEDPFPAYLDGIDTTLAPFCPTSATRVLKALTMANVQAGDSVVDLGSGDGRFITAAVAEHHASYALGIESDPQLVALSKELAQKVTLEASQRECIEFMEGDLLDLPEKAWTVIVVFLLPDHTDKFADMLIKYYRQGARIVSLVFNLSEIPEFNLVASDEPEGIYVYQKKP
jgi:SAM-dependent methyltransferase